jgi:hypothetical protein
MQVPAACVVALVSLCSLRADAEPQAPDLVDLTAAYVLRFVDAFANVVAEEQYTQKTTSPRGRRTLRSDFLVVRYPGAAEWHVFRDVFEVDGSLIRDAREERLLKLFLEPAERALPRAAEIARAAAQYNIQEIGNANNPLLTMAFLQRPYRDRFRFTVGGRERKLGATIRTIRFEEFRVPTIFRLGGNRDLRAHGLIWADETTGHIVKTELRLGGRGFEHSSTSWEPPTSITTTFGLEEKLGIDVPLEMRDLYPVEKGEVTGVATYTRFRRFQVATAAEIQ